MSEHYHDYITKLQLTQKLLAELLAEAQTNGLPAAPRGTKRGRPGRVSEEVRAAVVTAYRAGGISQADIAARHGISQTLVCQIVAKGETARVTAAKIAAGVIPAPRPVPARAPCPPASPRPAAPPPASGSPAYVAAMVDIARGIMPDWDTLPEMPQHEIEALGRAEDEASAGERPVPTRTPAPAAAMDKSPGARAAHYMASGRGTLGTATAYAENMDKMHILICDELRGMGLPSPEDESTPYSEISNGSDDLDEI